MNKILILAVAAMMTALNVKGQSKEDLSADEGVIQLRGCRRGTPNPRFAPRRAQLLTNDEPTDIGNRCQLVVLASFQDRDFKEDRDATLTKWDKIFNAENYTEDNYVGSVHDYFMAQSYGQFNLQFDLQFVELPGESVKYCSTRDNDDNAQYMVDDIVDVLQERDIDWSLYDWDGNGFVDQLLIIFAGEGMNATNERNTIWPHQWWLSQHKNLVSDDPDDFRSYRTITNGDKTYYIDCYCCVQEHVNYNGTQTPFGTICHEYTHCFGFPDFYYENGTLVLSTWDIMDYGCYNDSGFRPCSYSAHERMLMGWLTPVELTSPASITDMPALCDEPRAYLIRNDGAENEYYIIENRQQRGWDERLPGCGILVFHVDYDREVWTGTQLSVNSDLLKRYHIFPANNNARIYQAKKWAYPYVLQDSMGNDSIANNQLTNTSAPASTLNNVNVDGEKLMSKPITQMAVNANGMASFVFNGGQGTSIHHESLNGTEGQGKQGGSNPDDGWYLLDGRRLNGKPATHGLYIHQGKKVSWP
ncbi:MAG: M6 family metalloprotease domain-containing protein [Bacteroidaceae bacterium]|nr:M6 family metalloprotease domain-containing protein [Bacteroidaceae bacterium]